MIGAAAVAALALASAAGAIQTTTPRGSIGVAPESIDFAPRTLIGTPATGATAAATAAKSIDFAPRTLIGAVPAELRDSARAEAFEPALAGPAFAQQQVPTKVIVEVRFRGNYSLADEELLAAADVQPGEPLTPETLAAIEQRLLAVEGVGSVEILERYRSMTVTDEVVLLIHVREHVAVREKFMFLPLLTWTDEQGVSFGARFAMVDLLGLDERLSFPLTWGGERRAAAEIAFDLDRAAISHVAGGFGISQHENPHFELPDRRVGGWLDASKRWDVFEVGGAASFADVELGGAGEQQLELGVRAIVDTRQDRQLPRDAFYVRGAWDWLALRDNSRGIDRFTADLRGYKSFIGRSIVAAQAYYRGAGGRLPDWERPYLGGARTLRGYDAGAFIGDNIVLLATELRVPLTPPAPVGLVGLNFFFDSGAVYDHGTSLRRARFRNGVGAGVYFFAAFIGFQVDVAYGLASEEIHFHFSTGFRF
jgi:outer membrane protein assembly factor BamA